jgi:hypothetical protein
LKPRKSKPSALIFQQIGKEQTIVDRIINPAVEEVLKAVSS